MRRKRTNRGVLHAMSTEQLAMFINHVDCRNCAYCDESGVHCTKSAKDLDNPMTCVEGIKLWLDQEPSEFLNHLESEFEEED